MAGAESSMLPRKGKMTIDGMAEGPMQIMRKWHPNMPDTEEGQIEYAMDYIQKMRNHIPPGGVHPSVPYPVGSYLILSSFILVLINVSLTRREMELIMLIKLSTRLTNLA